jgi:hypothetical protein
MVRKEEGMAQALRRLLGRRPVFPLALTVAILLVLVVGSAALGNYRYH